MSQYLKKLSDSSGCEEEQIVSAAVTFFRLYLLCGYGASLIRNLIGFIYPAYFSIKAIESNKKKDKKDQADDNQWLTFWVVYSLFSMIEAFSDMFLWWFPFYYTGKCLFLIWCMAPGKWNGSDRIYNHVISPFFLKHVEHLDSMVNDLTSNAKTNTETKNDHDKDQ